MLTKMGYIPGSGLGPPTRQGRAEPIGITMRPPRSGLGVAEAQQQAQQQQEAQRAQRGMGGGKYANTCMRVVQYIRDMQTYTQGFSSRMTLTVLGTTDAARMAHEQDVRAGFVNSQAGAFDRRQHARQLAQAQQVIEIISALMHII